MRKQPLSALEARGPSLKSYVHLRRAELEAIDKAGLVHDVDPRSSFATLSRPAHKRGFNLVQKFFAGITQFLIRPVRQDVVAKQIEVRVRIGALAQAGGNGDGDKVFQGHQSGEERDPLQPGLTITIVVNHPNTSGPRSRS